MSQKVMPLVGLPCETLCGHSRALCSRGGLQDVKEVEPNRLLDLESGALRSVFSDILHPDIASAPKIGHILHLRSEQLLEPLGRYAIQTPLSATAEFLGRGRLRRMVNHVLGKLDRTIWPSFNCKGDLAEVLAVDDFVRMGAQGFQHGLSRTCQGQAAFFSRMTEYNTAVFRIAGPVMEQPAGKGSRLSRVVAVGGGTRFVRCHLRRYHDVGFCIEERHIIGDGGHVPVDERH